MKMKNSKGSVGILFSKLFRKTRPHDVIPSIPSDDYGSPVNTIEDVVAKESVLAGYHNHVVLDLSGNNHVAWGIPLPGISGEQWEDIKRSGE